MRRSHEGKAAVHRLPQNGSSGDAGTGEGERRPSRSSRRGTHHGEGSASRTAEGAPDRGGGGGWNGGCFGAALPRYVTGAPTAPSCGNAGGSAADPSPSSRRSAPHCAHPAALPVHRAERCVRCTTRAPNGSAACSRQLRARAPRYARVASHRSHTRRLRPSTARPHTPRLCRTRRALRAPHRPYPPQLRSAHAPHRPGRPAALPAPYLPTKFSSTELLPALCPPTTAICGRSRLAFCPMAAKASCSRLTSGIRSSIPRFPMAAATWLFSPADRPLQLSQRRVPTLPARPQGSSPHRSAPLDAARCRPGSALLHTSRRRRGAP